MGIKNSIKRILVNNYPVKQILAEERRKGLHGQLVEQFITNGGGERYGIGIPERKKIVERFQHTIDHVEAATTLYVHLMLAEKIMAIPPDVKGDVVECGCFKGASTANLSIICKMVNRKLLVCDSFEGLPDDGMELHTVVHTGVYGYYKEGMFHGSFPEVESNIEKYGEKSVCVFIKGFFNESLKQVKDPVCFAFIDVDLVSSTKDCLLYLWPLLIENGEIYSDDACDLDVVKVFYDEQWWMENLQCPAPGFVGSGSGLPPCHSSAGYTKKITHIDLDKYKKVNHLYYPEK